MATQRPRPPKCAGYGPWHVLLSLARAASLAVGIALAGCQSLPPARTGPPPPGPAPTTSELSKSLDMVGAGGKPLSPGARAQVVSALKAEGDAALLTRHLAAMTQQGEVSLYRGNAARLLIDGPQAFAAMFAAIEAAHDQVLLESYIIEDQSVAARLAELLIRKQAQGVRSFVIYDDLGSFTTSPAYFARLREHGVAVCAFNPVNPIKRPGYWSINHRDHRKILVVDDDVAFTGGINISQVYVSGSGRGSGSGSLSLGSKGPRTPEAQPQGGWRDTQIELRGPVVAGLAALVQETWQRQGCEGMVRAQPTAGLQPRGERVVQVLASGPDMPENRIYRSLLAAIDASQRSVHLTMAYFAPGPEMLAALCDAARRGVQVQIIMPSRSDFTLVLQAGRSYYTPLLKAGVRIFELQSALLHAKTAVVDGVVSTVGSSNMDWRSFASNNEANVVVLGQDFAGEVEAMFQRDLADSQEITLQSWRQRPLLDRAQQWFGRLVERLL